MSTAISRRSLIYLVGGALISRVFASRTAARSLETLYKFNRLVLAPSDVPGAYDGKAVDCPFVFRHDNMWWMTFVAFDGIGYQTGLAKSRDLVNWHKVGCILKRDPNSPIRKYNVAMNWIVRENGLSSPGELIRIGGQFVGAYHAYPGSGYEQGAAVIGLAYSRDLLHWEAGEPILHPDDGAEWERGGLYKPCLLRHEGTYYLFYNAKNRTTEAWHEQTGVATSRDLKTWSRYKGNPILRNGGPGSPDERFASDPCVLQNGPGWAIFYFGLDAKGVARDLVATGPDLLHATKRSTPLIDVGPPGSYDSQYAHKPSVVCANGDLYHFYCAVGGSPQVRGIAVARSRAW